MKVGGGLHPDYGDLNGDGLLDVTVFDGASVWIWHQGPVGSFSDAPTQVAVSDAGFPGHDAVTVADVDGDGDDDLVVGETGGFLLLPQRTGELGTPSFVPALGVDSFPTLIRSVQWDGDVGREVAVRGYLEGTPVLRVADLHQGTWTMETLLAPSDLSTVIVEDVDLDGDTDVLVGTHVETNVHLQGPAGVLGSPISSPTPIGLLADLNGDGELDLVVATSYYPGDGMGGFGPAVAIPGASSWVSLADDVNGDGLDDALSGFGSMQGSFAILQGTPGSFATACDTDYGHGGDPTAVVDLDADGRMDLLIGALIAGPEVLWGTDQGTAELTAGADQVTIRWGQMTTFSGYAEPMYACPSATSEGARMELLRGQEGASGTVDRSVGSRFGYVLADSPPNLGTYRYVVRYRGDARHPSVESAPIDVTVVPPETVVRMTATPSYVVYGRPFSFTVQLRPWYLTQEHRIDLYLREGEAAWAYWKTVRVDPETGTFTGSFTPSILTKIQARWAGDATWPSFVSEPDAVFVRVWLEGQLRGASDRQGAYRLYRPGRDVVYVTQVYPPVVRKETILVERNVDGSRRPILAGMGMRSTRHHGRTSES
jgi:hypothetical protein